MSPNTVARTKPRPVSSCVVQLELEPARFACRQGLSHIEAWKHTIDHPLSNPPTHTSLVSLFAATLVTVSARVDGHVARPGRSVRACLLAAQRQRLSYNVSYAHFCGIFNCLFRVPPAPYKKNVEKRYVRRVWGGKQALFETRQATTSNLSFIDTQALGIDRNSGSLACQTETTKLVCYLKLF